VNELVPGTEVRARGLSWDIVSSQPAGDQILLRLRCTDSGLLGHELDILVPFEHIEPVARDIAPQRAARLADWRLFHQAFLLDQALGANALLAAQPGRLQLAAYQLVPVMRALRMSRPRLLLADGVGLGKTIEAGLILAELIARRRAHRILIVSPAGPLLNQWQQEMRERFGLRFRILDRDSLQEIRLSSELGANPFAHEAFGLISIDFAKQERVLQDLARSQFDVVVIDEAHHCVDSRGADGSDSQRRSLAELLARQCDALLLLTATPHDGFDEHFASLVELLDPSLVNGKRQLREDAYKAHVVRRLKRHIKDPVTGAPQFRERKVTPRAVGFSAATHPKFADFQAELLKLISPHVKRALRAHRYSEVLAFVSLLKRSVSTVAACRNTLEAIADRIQLAVAAGTEEQDARKQRLRSLKEYRKRLGQLGVLSAEEERDCAALEAEDVAAELVDAALAGEQETEVRLEARREGDKLKRLTELRDGLRALVGKAEASLSQDPKIQQIVAELVAIRQTEPLANVLVYTEYTDSQDALATAIKAALKSKKLDGELLVLSGEDPEKDRTEKTAKFVEQDGLVFVSTDATAEGLNLHSRCHHLIHLELPYNPNRLEQRNGRIDRFGQTHEPQVKYLYLSGTFEERLLLRLVAKFERQRRRLSFVPNTLGVLDSDTSVIRLLEGVADEEGQLFKASARVLTTFDENVDDLASPAYRDLMSELDRVFTGFDRAAKSLQWLADGGLSADERLLGDAAKARAQSGALIGEDLLAFVLDALRSQSADSVQERADGIIALRLPPDWRAGIDDMPGYDAGTHTLLVTRDLEQTHDADKRSVGFLGRAHPIVRVTLERVRNLRLGPGQSQLDRRASAASWPGARPELLCTFLCRMQSQAGREFERVVAVQLGPDGVPQVFLEPKGWLGRTDSKNAVSPKDLWTHSFESWAPARMAEPARSAAAAAFEPLAMAFAEQHTEDLAREQSGLGAWLRLRAEQICGSPEVPQLGLFERGSEAVSWRTASDPVERLAGFSQDPAVPHRLRQEAAGCLELHRRRLEALIRRLALSKAEVLPLGLLMLVPAGHLPQGRR